MKLQLPLPSRQLSHPISSVWILRVLAFLLVVMSISAGYFYVSLQAQKRISAAFKRKYETCQSTTVTGQLLDDTAVPR